MTGMRVFLARYRKNQADLAEAAEISTSAVSQFMTGVTNPSKSTIDAWLSWATDIDPAITYEDLFLQPEPTQAIAAEAAPLPVGDWRPGVLVTDSEPGRPVEAARISDPVAAPANLPGAAAGDEPVLEDDRELIPEACADCTYADGPPVELCSRCPAGRVELRKAG